MARLDDVASGLSSNILDLSDVIREHWDIMMLNASLRTIMEMRLQIVKLLKHLSGKRTKAQRRTLNKFINEVQAISKVELNSSTYIMKICKPTNALKTAFEEYLKTTLNKVLDEDEITAILKKVRKTVKKANVKVVVDNTTENTEELAELPKAA